MDTWLIILIIAFVLVDGAITLVFVKALATRRRARAAEDDIAPPTAARPGSTTDAAAVAESMGLGPDRR